MSDVIELPGAARVLFTQRHHGNMSSVGGDGAADGARARERLRELIGVSRLARGYQVHGTTVRLLTGEETGVPTDRSPDADGQATALGGVGVMVLTADCLPVALGCERAVAMVHAGWRGLAAGVLEQGMLALRELAGPGEPIVAVIGPGAGACCYEVGEDVNTAFGRVTHGRGTIDLRALARDRLLAAGAVEVRDVEACTICDERYFSHRREGERAGRQAGVAWLS